MFALTKTEVRQVLAAVDLTSPFGQRDYLLVLFLYHTGLRVGECAGLITHLVARDGQPRLYLHLPASVCKGSRGRVVPLNDKAQACVRQLLAFNSARGLSPRRPRLCFRTAATVRCQSAPFSNWWRATGKRPGLMCAPLPTRFATRRPLIWWPPACPDGCPKAAAGGWDRPG